MIDHTEDYLQQIGMGYEGLSEAERKVISNFALIWSLFEAQLFDNYVTAKKLMDKSHEWAVDEDCDFIDANLDYFKQRYVENVEFNYRFEHLHFRKHDYEEKVKSVLLSQDNDLPSKLACCLLIVWRFRNNYFHGIKWAYQFRDQRENFELSNRIMTKYLQKNAR